MCAKQRKRTRFRVLFSRLIAWENQEDQTDYMLNTTPDDLAFRKATNAKPRRPVPRSKRLLGSGVTEIVAFTEVESSVEPLFSVMVG
jgi:hypothetical protein